MSPSPVTVAAARSQAAKRYDRSFGDWSVSAAVPPVLDIPLHPPTERAALSDQSAAAGWVRSWVGTPGVVWGERRWASLGTQRVPERLVLAHPADAAAFCGRAAHWTRVLARARTLLGVCTANRRDGFAPAVARCSGQVAGLDEPDFERLTGVLAWLAAHPDSGLFVRQLPIRGVDSKWVERHRKLVERLHSAASGRDGLGLAGRPDLVRTRFLDPRLAPGGLVDVSAPLGELATLQVAPHTVFVFENLETVLAMPAWEGAVVVHGSGYAVDRLGRIPWIRTSRVVYWGDLDSHGLAILNRLRAQPLTVVPVLMDLATLDTYRDLWVPEPKPATGTLSHLLPAEQRVVAGLAERGNVRLEQERLDWEHCLNALATAAARDAGAR